MNVGDTFFFDEKEFSIKNIDRTSSKRFPTGRVDASMFIGEAGNEDNPRTIQRGRPRVFNLSDVASALGEDYEDSTIISDLDIPSHVEESWADTRNASVEEIKEVFTNSDSDW